MLSHVIIIIIIIIIIIGFFAMLKVELQVERHNLHTMNSWLLQPFVIVDNLPRFEYRPFASLPIV